MTTLYVLPTTDTHCFDEDTKTDCWSFSREILLQEIAKAEQRGREAMRQECVAVCDKWIKAAKDDTTAVGIALAQQEIKELK